MPTSQLSVRNLDPKVVTRLKARAQKHGRSLESEVRTILDQVTEADSARANFLRELSRIQASFAGRKFSDSTELIRRDRDRR